MQTEIAITAENRVQIMSGRICPYCGGQTKFVNSRVFYNQNYGMAYYCEPCGAWVGCHRGTTVSLGRLANCELRALKIEGHKWFDPLWKKLMNSGYSKSEARNKTYLWLAAQMVIDVNACHFGMFNAEQCRQAIIICKREFSTSVKKLKKEINK